ncbi:MAG: GldM family protein [Ferruginibacter sp.]
MKQIILLSLSAIFIMSSINKLIPVKKVVATSSYDAATNNYRESATRTLSNIRPGFKRMSSLEFKSQRFCRADVEDFDFDARFSIIGAKVYFSGTNFRDVTVVTITSSSLKPLESFMSRCGPGSFVVFDEVKVVGPDKAVRIIPGVSLELY